MNRLLKPLLKDARREAEIRAAPGVVGKVITRPNAIDPEAPGVKLLIIEMKGRDIWRGGAKSIDEALERGTAGIGVDAVVLQRAQKLDINVVAIVVEELQRLSLTTMDMFFDQTIVRTRANWRGRSTRIVPYEKFQHKYITPPLKKRRKRDIAE
jgi:hypothetical protein